MKRAMVPISLIEGDLSTMKQVRFKATAHDRQTSLTGLGFLGLDRRLGSYLRGEESGNATLSRTRLHQQRDAALAISSGGLLETIAILSRVLDDRQ